MSINNFFNWLPETILNFSYYITENSGKGDRIRLLIEILKKGPNEFLKNESSKKLLEFTKPIELDEWIISGLTKKEQDDIFHSDYENENETIDSP
jgi:hypothetical protein